MVLPLPQSISCGESCLLVSWCACDRCGMAGNDEDHGRSRRPGAEDRGWSSIGRLLSGQTIERLGDTMCGLHRTVIPSVTKTLVLLGGTARGLRPPWPQHYCNTTCY
jgi:hypothetical protein